MTYSDFRCALMASSAVAVVAVASPAWAQTRSFDIAAQPAATGISAFARQADVQVLVSANDAQGRRTSAVRGQMTVDAGLRQLLVGSGLSITSGDGRTYTLGLTAPAQTAQYDEATTLGDIIVTAQKREESIQDVPIAVSAFSAETLDAMKIEGGSELLRAIPNVSFSKSNFSMYNFAIRGIGTKAISSSSDPAVAISFNNSPMLRNRLFEAEYLDVSRVEVLRGPQGTLYGRNATAGVVNMIPNLPKPDFDAMMKVEAGNFGSVRGQGMVNIPLSETFWVRGAASMTKREGFDLNTHTDRRVNGRDLYSLRLSAAWEPTDRFRTNLIWERFGEDDDRSRTGKQLCTTDPGPEKVGSFTITNPGTRGKLSQGCLPGSLYSDAAYGAPNASGMAQLQIMTPAGIVLGADRSSLIGRRDIYIMEPGVNPYAGVTQSKNLREISAGYNPKFKAENDIVQFNAEYDLTDSLKLHSQTLYTKDRYFSTQDYARYVSNDVFNDSNGVYSTTGRFPFPLIVGSEISPGGIYTDPQLGPSRGMLSADLSQSKNDQFYQELRIQTNIGGKYEFSIGANYLKFDVEDNYYVFNNTFTMMAEYFYGGDGAKHPVKISARCKDSSTIMECVYVDYTPISSLAGDGHNYFRSKNVVKTRSYALFGELYAQINDQARLTLGGRYTHDEKTSTPYPSQLLLGYSDILGGFVTGGAIARGLIADPDIEQVWNAYTGRAVFDWKFTEDVMGYASLARGYKGGGTNPPRPGLNAEVVQYLPLASTFDPEYVTSLEAGLKGSFYDGRLRLNLTGFYYDYEDYQVSQIVDRISLNENFDVKSMGLEFEAVWRPAPQLRLDANIGYLKTEIGKGEKSIDVMNRTQGNEDWMVVRPWVQVPSNCIAPKSIVKKIINSPLGNTHWLTALSVLCGSANRIGSFHPDFPSRLPFYAPHLFGFTYSPLTDAPNNGRGFDADLSGNELPNAPRWTANVGAQYTWFVGNSELTLRGDYYRQADSYFRVYNTEYDKIRGWDNFNLAVTWDMPQQNMTIQAYVKNVFDDAPIVDAFTNSDDTMLTTNVFTLDPRIWGFSLTKRF